MADLAPLEDLEVNWRTQEGFSGLEGFCLGKVTSGYSSPKASPSGILPQFGTSVKERNMVLECHTYASAGALHVGVLGHWDLPEKIQLLAEACQQCWQLSRLFLISTSNFHTMMLNKLWLRQNFMRLLYFLMWLMQLIVTMFVWNHHPWMIMHLSIVKSISL